MSHALMGVAAFLLGAGTLALWIRGIRNVSLPVNRIGFIAGWSAAAVLSVFALVGTPGWIGGVFATLCDSACGCAVQTMLPGGTMYTSLDLSVKYLRSARLDTGLLTCEATVTHFGRRTALAEATITDRAGKLYATATSSCIILTPS